MAYKPNHDPVVVVCAVIAIVCSIVSLVLSLIQLTSL